MERNRQDVLKPFLEQADYMNDRVKSGIEQNRKGWFTLKVKDKEGKPVPGATVEIEQISHEFRYGANLFLLDEMESAEKNAEYRTLFKNAFNLATLPFYWADLEREQGKPRYAADSPKIYRRPAPDLCLQFCEENGIEPKCHCLNHDVCSPGWLPDTVPGVRGALYQRFSELSERYAKRIPSWEVTNETLFPQGRTANYHTDDMVEWSFHIADRLFPLNRLIINEAQDNIWAVFNGNRSAYYMQIERLLRSGARLDSIGMQFHMFFKEEEEAEKTAPFYSPERIYAVLDRYADFGLPIQITELTIPAYHWTASDEEIQAEIIKNVYSMWFSHPSMEAIVYWNLVDGYAYGKQGDMTSRENYYHGGLVRYDMTPKKAYTVVRDLFRKEWHTGVKTVSRDDGSASFKGFYGEYEVKVHTAEQTRKFILNCSKNGKNTLTVTL